MKITVVGIGYVGLSLAALLAQKNEVIALDIDIEKVNMVNNKQSPIEDEDITTFLLKKDSKLSATTKVYEAYKDADYVIIATPTDYDSERGCFNTDTVEKVVGDVIDVNRKAAIIIKSTIPVGFTESVKKKYNTDNIIFSPEFLREGRALYDNLYPSRIIVGDKSKKAKSFAKLLIDGAIKKDIAVIFTNSSEAEAIKLFSNTFLALRVAYFNELDSFAEIKELSTKRIIEGVCSDPRIGNYYNNPSFGYGGYCLPKDTQQLRADYQGTPQNIISAAIEANNTRKEHIADMILKKKPKTIGIYRLAIKKNSDNFRHSAMLGVMDKIMAKEEDIDIIIYEPTLGENYYEGIRVMNDFDTFIEKADVILANRVSNELIDSAQKVYTRDLFGRD